MSDSPDSTELRFGPFANLIIERHRDDDDESGMGFTPDYCRETAALVFVEAAKVVDKWRGYTETLERASTRDRERYQKLKEEKHALEEKVVELDRRLRDPNRLRPDPLGPSVPRGRQQELVDGPMDPTSPWCEGAGERQDEPPDGMVSICERCNREVKLNRGHVPRHKVQRA